LPRRCVEIRRANVTDLQRHSEYDDSLDFLPPNVADAVCGYLAARGSHPARRARRSFDRRRRNQARGHGLSPRLRHVVGCRRPASITVAELEAAERAEHGSRVKGTVALAP